MPPPARGTFPDVSLSRTATMVGVLLCGCGTTTCPVAPFTQTAPSRALPARGACERIDERQRRTGEATLAPIFRRCFFARGGAFGVIPLPSETNPDHAAARKMLQPVQVVFEAATGESAVSDPVRDGDGVTDLQVVDTGAAHARVLLRTDEQLRRVHFPSWPDPSPPGTGWAPDFLAAIVDAAPERPLVWTNVVPHPEQRATRVELRLPSLRWDAPVAYGGTVRGELPGVAVGTWLDAQDGAPSAASDLTDACREREPLRESPPAALWSAAQCERWSGQSTTTVLRRVEQRCLALARLALPLVRNVSTLDRKRRDGELPERSGERTHLEAELLLVNPPSACFATGDSALWNVDYTGRGSPFTLPHVSLPPAWASGLDALHPPASR